MVVIGFEETVYTVSEDERVAMLTVRVLSGSLSGPVVVRVDTSDGTARGRCIHFVCTFSTVCKLPYSDHQ